MNKLAIWNPAREAWENWDGEIDLFSTHSDVYSETWPSSGTTRNGWAYEQPTPAQPMVDTGFLFLPTPSASEPGFTKDAVTKDGLPPTHGSQRWYDPDTGRLMQKGLPQVVRLLKTPTSQLAINGGSQHPDKRKAGGHGPTLADEVEHLLLPTGRLLPTPKAGDGEFVSGSTSGRPVEMSTRLGTIALLQAGHLEHRRTGASTNQPSAVGKP